MLLHVIACACILLFVDYDSNDDGEEYECSDHVSALNRSNMRRNQGKKYASLSTDDTPQSVRARCTAHNALYSGLSNSRYPPPPPRSRSDNALSGPTHNNMTDIPTLGGYSDTNSLSTSSLPHSNNSSSSPSNSADHRQQGNGSAFGIPYTDRQHSDTEDDEYYPEDRHDLTPNAYIRGGGRTLRPPSKHQGTGGTYHSSVVIRCYTNYCFPLLCYPVILALLLTGLPSS